MNRSQLRARLAKDLNLRDVPKLLWRYLEAQDFVGAALDPDLEAGYDELVRAAKDLLALSKAMQGQVCRGSVADRLRELGAELTQRYNILGPLAVWFVLTDKSMRPLPIPFEINDGKYDDFSYNRITLTVDPWVPAKTVENTYRELQKSILHKDNRPLTERHLALARFIADHGEHENGESKSGPTLIAEWNQVYAGGYPE